MAASLLSPEQRDKFQKQLEVDVAYAVPSLGRFRCNVFQQRGTIGLVMRVIPSRVPTVDELQLPPVLKKIADEERGLILVTGTTGSGKSTTLAAMIEPHQHARPTHIMTVEDPIEYLHRDNKSIINQREIRTDTGSFAMALRSALRQDPDVILVGEMRDFETVETALLAAETGHLVFSTLHTLDAPESINRIVAVFPPHQQRQVRLQLASILKAVVSQRLMPRSDGHGRVAAVEVMTATPFIRDCILDKDKTHSILGAIAAGTSQYGMQTFDQSIFGHYKKGVDHATTTRCATPPTRTSSSSRSRACHDVRNGARGDARVHLARTSRSHASAGNGFPRASSFVRPGAARRAVFFVRRRPYTTARGCLRPRPRLARPA